MATQLKLLSRIDKVTKYAVYGWIREKEKQLKLGTVPSAIATICVLYYREDEIFDILNEEIKASENKKVIKKISEIRGICDNNIMELLKSHQ